MMAGTAINVRQLKGNTSIEYLGGGGEHIMTV